ncbi:hypothetical protein LX32DRAFT_191976 [Colletotrichum zoysiae]|uniref:Uncharacterized protein n=1 Tax=Colletotrichum zoysiae TaxID=1216348 RepID=A0AAD9H620_9PEZI|nr:hypothetical protein LX32DRAFT_191976 [Colletotrichum zoysiae]
MDSEHRPAGHHSWPPSFLDLSTPVCKYKERHLPSAYSLPDQHRCTVLYPFETMGCNPSRPADGPQADVEQGPSSRYPLTIVRPPRYSYNEHNEACRVLRPWETRGAKSRSFTFVVHVINNSMLDRSQTLAQVRLLGHIQQLASVHRLQVLVKCLDYLSETDDDPNAADEKQLYLDMLAARSKAEIIRMWDHRPTGAIHQDLEEIATAEHRIGAVIEQIRWNRDLGDVDVKNQIEPEIVLQRSLQLLCYIGLVTEATYTKQPTNQLAVSVRPTRKSLTSQFPVNAAHVCRPDWAMTAPNTTGRLARRIA